MLKTFSQKNHEVVSICTKFTFCVSVALLFNLMRPLEELRNKADMVRIFPNEMKLEELFGLTEPSVIKILESVSY